MWFLFSFLLGLGTVCYSSWWKFLCIYWLQKNSSFFAMVFIHDQFSTFFYTYPCGMFNTGVWMDRIYRNQFLQHEDFKTYKSLCGRGNMTENISAYSKPETNLDVK